MTVSEKIKTVDNKKEQNKTAKISDLSSGTVSKYKFSSGEDVLAEIKAVKKAATIKIFQCSTLSCELKKKTAIIKQHQGLGTSFGFDKP